MGDVSTARSVLSSERYGSAMERGLKLMKTWVLSSRRDADSIALYHFAGDMASEDYNNPLTRMVFERVQKSPPAMKRMVESMTRERSPFEVVKPATLLRWLLAESGSGRLAPWSALGRTMRLGLQVARQQAVLDRALAKAERGDLDTAIPVLT